MPVNEMHKGIRYSWGSMIHIPGNQGYKFSRFLLLLLIIVPGFRLSAQAQEEYDEISVLFAIQRVGSYEISAVIGDDKIYLPVSEIFDILKIKNNASTGLDTISGFFINPKNTFFIDYPGNNIQYMGMDNRISKGGMIKTETNLYLQSDYFGKIFELYCKFNFRALAVTMDTKLDLPVIREMRLAQMRANITKLKGETKADTNLARTYPWFRLGMADWSVISNQIVKGRNDTRLNLALGAVVAGGEANVSLLFNNHQRFDEKQQQYLWRYANNDFKFARQILLGKIASQATSSIYAPVIGMQVTNTPTTYRRSFGYYNLSDKTEPGWTVELYVNNVLVDFVKADASGFFTFQVPLVYGNSAVMLKYYGPWGEERTKEQNISIPFNFLPPGEMQYTASAGIVEDSLSSRYSRANFNYGVNNRLTVGAGTEYLSSVSSGAIMPFISSSVRLASSLLLSGEYTYGVRSKGILTYRFPSNLQFEVYYTRYDKGQKAINYNYLEERKAVVAIPLRTNAFSAFSRLTLNQIILPETKYTTAELLLSGALFGASTNFTTYAMFIDPKHPYTYSNLSFSFRLPRAFVLIPQAQYEYTNNKLISLKCGIEKHLAKNAFINLSYENNFRSNIQNIEFGFRYDFSFAQTAFTARKINKNYQLTQSAKGSFLYNQSTRDIRTSSRTNVGKGGLVFKPFLDLDCDGVRDADEPGMLGLNMHISGGRMENNLKDSSVWVYDLEPYTSYFVEFDKNSFDNISWQLKFKSMRIAVDPNQFRLVEVPVSVFSEASGMVYLEGAKGIRGLGRVILCFYDETGKLVGRTLSESDGYFSFLGLPPGKYIARVDSTQLRKINMTSSPDEMRFQMQKSLDGDVKDDFEFILSSKGGKELGLLDHSTGNSGTEDGRNNKDTNNVQDPFRTSAVEEKKRIVPTVSPFINLGKPETAILVADTGHVKTGNKEKPASISAKDPVLMNALVQNTSVQAIPVEESSNTAVPGEAEAIDPAISDKWVIQAGAFLKNEYAQLYKERLEDALTKQVITIKEGNYYRVLVIGFNDSHEAKNFLPHVRRRGFVEAYITRYRP